MSVPPPAGYGTMSRMGRVGNGSAATSAAAANVNTMPPKSAKNARRLAPDIRAPPPTKRIAHDAVAVDRCAAGFRAGYDRCGSDSVIRRCRLNVRFTWERTWLGHL